MAYDKVVDSAVLDAGLKQIADAIREKGGTSGNLAFPTAMADAIAAIQAGGGGGGVGYHEIVTFANATKEYTIEHNLNSDINLCLVVPMDTNLEVSPERVITSYVIMAASGEFHLCVSGTYGLNSSSIKPATAHEVLKNKTYECIEVVSLGLMMAPKTVTKNTVALSGLYYSFAAGTYFIYCGSVNFGGAA